MKCLLGAMKDSFSRAPKLEGAHLKELGAATWFHVKVFNALVSEFQ